MLDGRVLEASQVEYKPFGKPPLQRERVGTAQSWRGHRIAPLNPGAGHRIAVSASLHRDALTDSPPGLPGKLRQRPGRLPHFRRGHGRGRAAGAEVPGYGGTHFVEDDLTEAGALASNGQGPPSDRLRTLQTACRRQRTSSGAAGGRAGLPSALSCPRKQLSTCA